MRKVYVIAVMLFVTIGAFAQEGKIIYNKYADSKAVTAVYISPAMFKMIGQLPELEVDMGEEDIDIAPLIRNLEGLYVLEISDSMAGRSISADVKSMISKSKQYELMMEVRDEEDKVQIYTIGDDKVIKSLVFLCTDDFETEFICIDGNINRSDLESLIAAAIAAEKN